MSKIELPLSGRTFERRQGCWNCTGLCDQATSLQHWRAVGRPEAEARIAQAKLLILTQPVDPAMVHRFKNTANNAPCPCKSGKKYKQCHQSADAAAKAIFDRIEGVEMATVHLDRFETAIATGDKLLGNMALCNERTSEKYMSFVSDKFMCDRWTGVQGASVAREGAKTDEPAAVMKEIHGDGN